MLSQSTSCLFILFSIYSCTSSAPISKREVPQEHSHNKFLTSVTASLDKNNPNGIVDSVFGLLGNAAAAGGAGKVTDLDCLHLLTADQAFTNAKAEGDVQGMTDALIYAALERNTGKVGLASALCTSVQATNPEVQAITQHQDPASPNAAATNKGIALELAKQIASIGGDPQQALQSGTFAPGNLNDNTGKGNTCDDANDPVGCIFTQNLLVEDATPAEISAAVAGAAAPIATVSAGTGSTADNGASVTATSTATATASTSCIIATATESASSAASSASSSSTGSFDFGSCSNPAIKFGFGFDGRNQNSFEPENETDFNHGSALNIGVIADFICGQLSSKCKASAATVTACQKGATAAEAQGATGGAADTFNGALGINTDFAASTSSESATATASAGSTDLSVSNSTSSSNTASGSGTSTSRSGQQSFASTTSTAAASGNLQTFTGDLGNISPPPVTADGTKFCVTGNSCFNSLSNALGRSCDVQHNKCADASNAAGQNPPFSVDDCQTQQNQCNAESSSGSTSTGSASAATSNSKTSISSGAKESQPSASASASAASSGNLQPFTGALGGVSAPPVTANGSQFCVAGNACFKTLANAIERSCDVQNNKCADASNAAGQHATFSVAQCQTQQTQCNS